MALDKASLKTGIQALHNELFANASNLTPAAASERYATQMADLIDAYVKTGKPQVPGTGLMAGAVAVSGSSITGTII